MKKEEQKLLDWQTEIEHLKTKTTELKTKTEMFEKQLAEFGIKDPTKAMDEINKLNKELSEIADRIRSSIEEIEEEFNLEEDEKG